jgi:hypothetical protein
MDLLQRPGINEVLRIVLSFLVGFNYMGVATLQMAWRICLDKL